MAAWRPSGPYRKEAAALQDELDKVVQRPARRFLERWCVGEDQIKAPTLYRIVKTLHEDEIERDPNTALMNTLAAGVERLPAGRPDYGLDLTWEELGTEVFGLNPTTAFRADGTVQEYKVLKDDALPGLQPHTQQRRVSALRGYLADALLVLERQHLARKKRVEEGHLVVPYDPSWKGDTTGIPQDQVPLYLELISLGSEAGMTTSRISGECPSLTKLPAVEMEMRRLKAAEARRAAVTRRVIVCAIRGLGRHDFSQVAAGILNIDGTIPLEADRRGSLCEHLGIDSVTLEKFEKDTFIELSSDLLLTQRSPCQELEESRTRIAVPTDLEELVRVLRPLVLQLAREQPREDRDPIKDEILTHLPNGTNSYLARTQPSYSHVFDALLRRAIDLSWETDESLPEGDSPLFNSSQVFSLVFLGVPVDHGVRRAADQFNRDRPDYDEIVATNVRRLAQLIARIEQTNSWDVWWNPDRELTLV